MTRNFIAPRMGATALAAVLALGSTPAMAQDADPAPTPVVDNQPAVATPPAPAAEAVMTTPTIDAGTAPSAGEATLAATATEKAAPPRRNAATKASTARSSRASGPTQRTVTNASAQVEPVAPDLAAPPQQIESQAAPVASPAVSPRPAAADTDMLPIVGSAGLAALALLGTGLAVRRRRRVAEDDRLDSDLHAPEAPVAAAPIYTPIAERSAFSWGNSPVESPSQNRKLPNGFDLSRFGRHVQAAYRGPSPDNPSLSLKKRLKRASFFDLRERQAAVASPAGNVRHPSLVPA